MVLFYKARESVLSHVRKRATLRSLRLTHQLIIHWNLMEMKLTCADSQRCEHPSKAAARHTKIVRSVSTVQHSKGIAALLTLCLMYMSPGISCCTPKFPSANRQRNSQGVHKPRQSQSPCGRKRRVRHLRTTSDNDLLVESAKYEPATLKTMMFWSGWTKESEPGEERGCGGKKERRTAADF